MVNFSDPSTPMYSLWGSEDERLFQEDDRLFQNPFILPLPPLPQPYSQEPATVSYQPMIDDSDREIFHVVQSSVFSEAIAVSNPPQREFFPAEVSVKIEPPSLEQSLPDIKSKKRERTEEKVEVPNKKTRKRLTNSALLRKIEAVEKELESAPKNNDLKEEKRRLKNTLSARKSRQDKKEQSEVRDRKIKVQKKRIESQDQRIEELESQNAILLQQMQAVKAENEKLKQRVEDLTGSSSRPLTLSFGNSIYNGTVFDLKL